MRITLSFAVVSAALFLPGIAAAADALDPKAEVPPLKYESPFNAYRPEREPKLQDWPQLNDKVRRLGGWKAFAKGDVAEDAPAQAVAPPVSKEPLSGTRHEGHGSH